MSMSVFLDIKNTKVNISKIREINIARKDAVRITFDDGSSNIYSTYGNAETDMKLLESIILQVIPCASPLYNIYKEDDGSYYRERVEYLVLCADGTIRSLTDMDGCFVVAEEAANFIGFFNEERLKDFPAGETEAVSEK
jgi:hypothetical protein